jgi:hypothetical protein
VQDVGGGPPRRVREPIKTPRTIFSQSQPSQTIAHAPPYTDEENQTLKKELILSITRAFVEDFKRNPSRKELESIVNDFVEQASLRRIGVITGRL